MGGWTKPPDTPPPGPAGPVWGAAAPDAGLPGFPTTRLGDIWGTLLRAARAGAAGRWAVVAGDDPAGVAPPDTEGVPVVRLTPQALPAEPVCSSPDCDGLSYRLPIRVVVDTAVGTADPTGSMALWAEVARTLFGAAPALEALGVPWLRLEAPAWGASADGDPQTDARGAVLLLTYFDVPFSGGA